MTEPAAYPFQAPFVGRDRELAEIGDAIHEALTKNEMVTVTLVGARGVGKTRVVDEALALARSRWPEARVLRATRREGAGLDPFARIVRLRAGLADGASDVDLKNAFETLVRESFGDSAPEEFVHVLGAFAGIAYPTSPLLAAVEDEPAQRSALQRAAVRRFLELDARRAPLIIALEDVDRASDDALNVIEAIAASVRGASIFLLVVGRPELTVRRPDWAQNARSRMLELAPLRTEEAALFVLRMLEPVGDVPEELVDTAVDVAGGSPSLLEQMIRAYVASGTLARDETGAWHVHLDRIDEAELPLTVEDAINARIASLSPVERKLLEHASVMGGVFWLGGLVALGRLDRKAPDLWGGAEDLAAHYRDLILELRDRDYLLELPDSSMPGELEVAFKHNLEREALYKLLNATEAKRLHLHVAEWLESRFHGELGGTGRSEEQCELLAQHFERGGATRRAGAFWLEAADRARARFANVRAAESYQRGLAFLGVEDEVQQLDALHNLGDVLQLAGQNDDALVAFQRMREIAFRLDLKAKGGVAHNRIGRVYRAIGHLDLAMRHLGTGHALFDAANDRRGVASSLDDVGKVHWMRGSYEAAERFLQKGLELRRELGDARSIALSLNNLGLVYQDSGRFEAARDAFTESIAIRRSIGDRAGIGQTLNNLGSIYQDQGDHTRASELYRESLEHARAVGDRMRQAVILTNLGETMYRLSNPEAAIGTLREAEQISASLGDRILEGEILRGLAKAHMLTHDLAEAKALIARSMQLFEQVKGKAFLAVALRTAGEIEHAASWGGESHERAQRYFEQSIQLLDELGNQVELARGCLALATFLESDPEAKNDPVRAHEIQRLRTRASDIQDRLHRAQSELTDLPDEKTDPAAVAPL